MVIWPGEMPKAHSRPREKRNILTQVRARKKKKYIYIYMCINTKFCVTQKYYSSCLTSSILITARFNIAPILRGREMRGRNVAFCKTRPFFFELKIGADVVCARHTSLSAPCSNVFLGKECTTSSKNLCAGDYFRILQNTFRRKKRLVAGYSGIPDCA